VQELAIAEFAVDEACFDERTISELAAMEFAGNDLFPCQIQRFENDIGIGGL
jgi:hypothetical protein